MTLGWPSREGALAPGTGLVVQRSAGTLIPTQWNPLATWKTDGSVLHGALTFLTPAAGDNSGNYRVIVGTPVGGAAVTKAELAATAFDAVISCNIGGTVYSLSAKHLLNGAIAPRRDYTHIAGPIMSEFCVGGPLRVNGTGTAHPYLTAWFNVRAYKIDGNVARAYVVCVLENTGARVERFDVTANVTISIAGNVVYTNNGFVVRADRRYPLRTWWPSDPQTWVRHNRAYLASTKLVPQYADITIDANWLNTMPQSLPWGGVGELDAAMASGGGKRELAPLDAWTAAYLISGDRRIHPCDDAKFLFDPVRVTDPKEWGKYWKRLVRYGRRYYEFQLLRQLLREHGIGGLPEDIQSVYPLASQLPYVWRGIYTPAFAVALRQMRRIGQENAPVRMSPTPR